MDGSTKQRLAVNWRQAAGEALLIFFGVGVALLAQAAWEGHAERVEARQHVAGLLDELRANRDGLQEFVNVHATGLGRTETVLRLIREPPSSARDDSLVSSARLLVAHNYFVPATAAMSNLMGAGGLGLLQDPGLRLRVTRYAQSVEAFNSFAADLSGFQIREMRPSLGRLLPLLRGILMNEVNRRGADIRASSFPPKLSGLRTLEFENLVFYRMAYEMDMADAVSDLLAEVEELIEVLESAR